ncbi:hypothetical protein LZ32DRAFT_657796 [Colletotrichum eremochloae]|nr:hypothetical protein LZ32DRAFT_657796 [Colletotrichum eremochloae]
MKVSFIFTLSYLITAVWAGGYQNCLERVWIFQSYLIDQHNPVANQRVGYKCAEWLNGACVNNVWVACRPFRPTDGRTKCNFDDFQRFMGRISPSPTGQLQGVYRADGSLDNQRTAVNCIWHWRTATTRPRNPFNFRGWEVVRGGIDDHNDFIRRLGQINNDNYRNTAVRKAAGDDAFKQTDDTLTRVTQARVADHGRFLITAARAALAPTNVVEKDMGANPYYRAGSTPADPERFIAVDWEATIKNSADPTATRAQVRAWLDSYYRGPTANGSARQHWQVLRSYKNVKDRTNRCREA